MLHAFEVSEFSASAQKSWRAFALLTFQSLGAIYGDIGTSPLYTLQTVMTDLNDTPSEDDIIGGVSLMLWSLIWLVCLKYCFFVMRAHNNGEGGIFALYSILKSSKNVPRPLAACAGVLAIVGAAFIVSDGGLTPAVSILSAVEGFAPFSPLLTPSAIVGITVAIVVVLFMCQRFGTAKVSSSFAPITTVWFVTIAVFGIINMAKFGGKIWSAFNPGLGIEFLVRNGSTGFTSLGAVFLTVTGLEAMYADIGHFGVNPVRAGWLAVVFPAVTLNYLGQGAVLLDNPSLYTNLFFSSIPGYNNDGYITSSYVYTVIIATLATIIASQAMITGAFSLASHAVSLDFLPPIAVHHTNAKIRGQIYIPVVCYVLMALTVGITAGFGTSTNITNAYGLTVCTVMVFTTLLYMMVIAYVWAQPWWKSVLFACLFLPVDFIFLASNYEKVPDGGYVPLITGVAFAAVMLLWRYGQQVRTRSTGKTKLMSKNQFAEALELEAAPASEIQLPRLLGLLGRTPNVGVFVCPESESVPPVAVFMLERTRTCPQVVVFFHTRVLAVPVVVNPDQRMVVETHGADVFTVTVQFGYAEDSNQSGKLDLHTWMNRVPADQPLSRWLHDHHEISPDKISVVTADGRVGPGRQVDNPQAASPTILTFFWCEEDYVVSERLSSWRRNLLSAYLLLKALTRPRLHSAAGSQLLAVTKVVPLGAS